MHDFINSANDIIWGYLLIYLLLGAGIYFTIRSRFVQFRHISHVFTVMRRSLKTERGGISSFGAFATGLAARVGTGNIAGVAIALTLGGPGAIFWMWIVSIVGMATSFVENTLAQIYKVKGERGTFRGGPAFYMERGLGLRWMASLFSILLVLTFGFVFIAVQSNSMTVALVDAFHWDKLWCGVGIAVLAAAVIFGGIRRIARFAEAVVPLMAIAYLVVSVVVVATNITELPDVVRLIVRSAFGIAPAASGGVGYAVSQALQQGVRRGLFSNEAGMGSSPNAAATAEVSHPAAQGFVQMLGVFSDTIIICTCTASIILLSGVLDQESELTGVQLTQAALSSEVGAWGGVFIAIVLQFFAFTTIVANYYFGQTGLMFLYSNRAILTPFRVIVLGFVMIGSLARIDIVWNAADLMMGLMSLLNLVAILLLSPIAFKVMKDYLDQLKRHEEPTFDRSKFPELEGHVAEDVW